MLDRARATDASALAGAILVGWILFHSEDPQRWGNIGDAMLNLFVMLTLEDFPVYMAEAMEIEPWAWVYFVSFILVAAFIVAGGLTQLGWELPPMPGVRRVFRREKDTQPDTPRSVCGQP